MTRPTRARINLQALLDNFSIAKQTAQDSRVMAVIKANAYGHGLVPVARVLADADAFAVAALDEAMALREAGINQPIVLLEGVFSEQELEQATQQQLQLVIHNEAQLGWLERARLENKLQVWLKIDTGMHRLGFPPHQAAGIYQRLFDADCVTNPPGWFSHFACADDPGRKETSQQLNLFLEASAGTSGLRSLANSAALLTRTDTHFDWVRPGIMLYGASPFVPELKSPVKLEPVMTLSSELIAVHRRQAGEAIGYGGSYVCPHEMSVGTVAIGYGDGYPRHAPVGTPVLVNGRRCSLVGRVSMDKINIDLTDAPDAGVGDKVVLWGDGLPVDEIASLADTIGYELLCGVTARVPRDYQLTDTA